MQMFIVSSEYCGSVAEGRGVTMMDVSSSLELQMKVHEIFTIMEKVPTRTFSWLKTATTAFTFKNLYRDYELLVAYDLYRGPSS